MNYGVEERKPVLVSIHHKYTRRILTLFYPLCKSRKQADVLRDGHTWVGWEDNISPYPQEYFCPGGLQRGFIT